MWRRIVLASRHAELVSASLDGAFVRRSAKGNGGPWILKQVQHDDAVNVALRSFPVGAKMS